jgi:hypothetical protein
MPRRPPKIPSVEAQTVAFLDACKHGHSIEHSTMQYAGFSIYLRYALQMQLSPERTVRNLLIIGNVDIPEKLRDRGWFWRYVQLCAALNDGHLLVQSVVNKRLLASLRNHPAFEEVLDRSFLLRQDQWAGPHAWLRLWPGEPQDHRSMPLMFVGFTEESDAE